MRLERKTLSNYLTTVVPFMLVLSSSAAHAKLCKQLFETQQQQPVVREVPEQLKRGLDVLSHNELLLKRIEFQKQAFEKNPNLEVLDVVTLDILKKEKIVVGFVGYSGGKAFNETASRIAITNFLRELDPSRVILSSGGTNEGVPALMYEIGSHMGFKTMGVTSLKSGDYAPGKMDYLIVEGNNWGRESDFFINTSDVIVGFGGGGQSLTEMNVAKARGVPLFPVTNAEIQGATANITGTKYPKGEIAGQKVRKLIDNLDFFKWVKKLPTDVHYVASNDLPSVFRGKRLVGFTGWSNKGPKANRDVPVEKFVREFLTQFDPSKDIITTGGTHIGAEKIVHEIAHEMGFTQVALVSHEIADPSNLLNPYVYAISPVAKTWEGRTFGFVNSIQALVSFGGGNSVSNQVKLAEERGIPVVHMTGNFTEFDKVVKENNKFRSGRSAGARILTGQ